MARPFNNLLLVNNPISYGEVYSNVTTTPSPETTVTNKPAPPEQIANGNSSPITFWLVAVALFTTVILWARYGGNSEGFGDKFKNIRPSVFNILFIGLVVAVALPVFKIIAAKVPNQSLRDYLVAI